MKLTLQSQVDKITTAQGQVYEYSQKERSSRAFKVLGVFWAGSLVSVLVPVLHFFLVPGLFLVGPLMAWAQYKKELKIESLQGICPECHKSISFINISGSWPLKQICPHCSQQIYIQSKN